MPSVSLKYYSLTDPVNSNPSKDIGYIITQTQTRKHEVTEEDGSLTVVSEEEVQNVNSVLPKEVSAAEITKEDYDALTVSSESSYMTARRLRKEQGIAAYKLRYNL